MSLIVAIARIAVAEMRDYLARNLRPLEIGVNEILTL